MNRPALPSCASRISVPEPTGRLVFGGIDPTGSEAKASGVALLDGAGQRARMARVHTDAEILAFFQPYRRSLRYLGLDGICKLPDGLHPCCVTPQGPPCLCQQTAPRPGRTAEWALSSLGIGCYYTSKRAFAKSWITRSLHLFTLLTAAGFTVLEIYPYASKRRLFGRQLPNKATRVGRQLLSAHIQGLGITLEHGRAYTHDELDAVLVAYTAYLHAQGRTIEVGEDIDGTVVIPR
ncbi:MAG: DUF429 domain-containing protein [Nitrospinae bacterium]|nr:DUF429 domain-containing protein [Nitrospinota bacterium]